MIIGITGYAGSGKDTVGRYLVKHYKYKQYAFADPIKEGIMKMFLMTTDQLWGERKNMIDERYGISPRQLLQYIGTDMAQLELPKNYPFFDATIGRNLWSKRFEYEKEKNPNVNYVITDLRFPHEEEMIRRNEGIIFRVNRDSVVPKEPVHESESYVFTMTADYEIDNNGSFEDLENLINDIMIDIEGVRK